MKPIRLDTNSSQLNYFPLAGSRYRAIKVPEYIHPTTGGKVHPLAFADSNFLAWLETLGLERSVSAPPSWRRGWEYYSCDDRSHWKSRLWRR